MYLYDSIVARPEIKLPLWREDPARVRPMMATLVADPSEVDFTNDRLLYEPKYDGIRALILVEPAHPSANVRIWSRLGNEKTAQFPELVRDFKQFAKNLKRTVFLDGEIVALDAHGEPVGFQRLQDRLHLTGTKQIASKAGEHPVAFIAFDVLREGNEDLRVLSLADRRTRLEYIFGKEATSLVRHGDFVAGDGRRIYANAEARGLEGLLVKEAASRYESGRRSPSWRKVKLTRRQEFVVGGWTEPRQTRLHFGALLLGLYDEAGRLVFVGQVGSGFTDAELTRVWKRLSALASDTCPFAGGVTAKQRSYWTKAEPAHWIRPELVAEVRFTEWTDDNVLRHPVYLGMRDDVEPRSVVREQPERGSAGEASPVTETIADQSDARSNHRSATAAVQPAVGQGKVKTSARTRSGASKRSRTKSAKPTLTAAQRQQLDTIVEELQTLEDRRRDGVVTIEGNQRLEVTNLHKVFWPGLGLTKGDLLRFYTRISPWILPAVADRAMVMKRMPDGVKGKSFYQQRAPEPLPANVRAELVEDDSEEGGEEGLKPMLVGGSLMTLLYMTQIASISQDPWFSRVQSPEHPDYVALDLDPMPGVPFARVLDVARWVRDELAAIDVPGVVKTSGSSGMHVYLPMPAGATYQIGQLFCQIVATVVASRHPKVATVERSVKARGRTVYVDYLQNIQGKTLATAYSARASEFAGVSTPLTWEELDETFQPEDFTMLNVLDRLERVGDLWAPLRNPPSFDLRDALDRLGARL